MAQLIKRLEINGHSGSIYTVDGFGDFVFTGSGDCFTAKWNMISGSQEKFALRAEKSVYKIRLLKNNSFLAIGTSSGALHIIDLEKKEEIKHFVQHKSAIFEIFENKQKNQIYSTDADGNLAIWNADTWDLILFLPLNLGKIRNINTNEDGTQIYLGCQNGDIKIFETSFFNEINSFFAHKTGVNSLILNPSNSNQLFSTGKDGFIRIWDLKTTTQKIEIPAHNFGIYQLEFLDSGKYFVSVSRDKSIKLWESSSLKVIQKIERKHGGHSHAVNAIYKKSETEIITVGDDKRIIYWELS